MQPSPPCQVVTRHAGEQVPKHGGPAGAYTYEKPRNPTENSHCSGRAAAVLNLSLPLEDEEADYNETCNGDYMRVLDGF